MKSMLIDPTKIRGSNIYGGRIKAPKMKDAKRIMKGTQSSINSKLSSLGKKLQELEKKTPKDKVSNITI